METTLKSFTDLVHKMRLAQQRYFELAAQARKTGVYTKEQKDILAISKNLEHQVDEAIKSIDQQQATPTPQDDERPALIIEPLTE
jgi:hypothetical protein